MVDGGLGVSGCMGGGGSGGGSLGGTLRGVLSRYWSLESLHSTTGKCAVQGGGDVGGGDGDGGRGVPARPADLSGVYIAQQTF